MLDPILHHCNATSYAKKILAICIAKIDVR